jgi:hypothetical protein
VQGEEVTKPTAKICECCGAKIVEYKHVFSTALAIGLHRLYMAGKPTNLRELILTRNQWDNFQKLRYWGLVEKFIDEDGNRRSGVWDVTPLGVDFIERNLQIPKHVWTYRGEFVRSEKGYVRFAETHPADYVKRPQYAAEAEAHNGA